MFKKFFEETNAGDIAQATPSMGLHRKCTGKKDCKCAECVERAELSESPVGMVGRTDAKSALAHLSPELKKRFRKLLKDIGGKTVMRYLLAETPLQEKMSLCQSASDALMRLQDETKSKKLQNAIDEVLDLMDTEC